MSQIQGATPVSTQPQGKPMLSTKAGGNGVFINAPDGTFVGVIVDVHEPTWAEAKGQFKAHWETRVVVQLNKLIDQAAIVNTYMRAGKVPDAEAFQNIGKRYVISQSYNFSLNEKASLRKFIESGLGVKLGDDVEWGIDELRAFLVGKNMLISVLNAPGKLDPTKIVPKISSQMPLPDGFPSIQVADGYIQKHLRTENGAAPAPAPAVVQAAPAIPVNIPASLPQQVAAQPVNVAPPVSAEFANQPTIHSQAAEAVQSVDMEAVNAAIQAAKAQEAAAYAAQAQSVTV